MKFVLEGGAQRDAAIEKLRKRTTSLKKRKESTVSHYLEQLLERSGWDGIRFSPRRHNLHHIGPQTDEKSLDMLVKIQRLLPQTRLEKIKQP